MPFTPAELHDRYRRLGEEIVRPRARGNDAAHRFDRDAWQQLAAADFCRLPVRPELGGRGVGPAGCAAALEGLAFGSGDLGFSVSAVAHWVCLLAVERFGTPPQHHRWLPRLLSGEWLGGVANAEPQAGTNLLALASRAHPTAAGFRLSADKHCITNVGAADLVLVSARLQDAPPRKEVNVFAVDTAQPGVEAHPVTDLEGLRTSCTGHLRTRDLALPTDALLGQVGQGLDLFRQMFAQERLYTGVLYLAALRLCLRRALEHAETRHQFGRPIGRNQYVQERVVRTRVAEELLACLLADLAPAVDRGDDVSDRLAVVKIHGIEAALEASADLMRLLGGRGMRQDEPAGKLHRDLLALSILGGTVELQKIVLYQELAKRVPAEPPRRSDVAITLHERGDLTPDLDRSLIELTARIFPDEPALRGRYYFDTPPDLVLAAWKDGQLAGFRIVVRRTVDLGSGAVRVAGLGIGVDPRFQRQGIGTELTRRALEVLRAGGDDLAVAFLFTPSAEKLLKAFGFRRLPARITFADRSTGAVREETAPAWALDLHRGTLVEDLGACGMVHLGAGAW